LLSSAVEAHPRFTPDAERGRYPWFSLAAIAAQSIFLRDIGLIPAGTEPHEHFLGVIRKDPALASFFFQFPNRDKYVDDFADDVEFVLKKHGCSDLLGKDFF
jgi:hypothetical protein